MRQRFTLMLLLALLSTVSLGCADILGNLKENGQENQQNENKQNTQVEPDKVQEAIQAMSMAEKLGQLVVVGIDGYELDQQTKEMIRQYQVGGFVIFGRNVRDSLQLRTLLNSLKEENATVSRIPLFLSVDEEGGRVSRMPEEFLDLPTSAQIGRQNEPALSSQVGSIIAAQLKLLGFNMDFAPVLDINSNPRNPVIGNRAFGSDAETVSKLGIATMKGLQSAKIISVVKHFPGHGDTEVDSHKGLPIVTHDRSRLNSFELIPFAEAIKNNADAVMVAHILLPQLDEHNPASLSKTVITDLLRTEMGFNGVVISDDLTMGAISENHDIGEAAVRAINAGSDLVLVCHGYEKEIAVLNALKNAVETGIIPEERIDQSVYRILKLKERYELTDEPLPLNNQAEINEAIENINQAIREVHQKIRS